MQSQVHKEQGALQTGILNNDYANNHRKMQKFQLFQIAPPHHFCFANDLPSVFYVL